MIGLMRELVFLFILWTITAVSIAVVCKENECCVIGSANRSYVIDCNENPVPHPIWYIQCADSGIWVVCSSEVTNGGIIGESNGSGCGENLKRIDFYNCIFPEKSFYDTIRTLSTSMNVTAVSLTSDRVRDLYIMGHHLHHFPELKSLNLYQGGVRQLSENMLQYVPKLENLNLSSNSITGMEFRFFRYAMRLKRVDLSFNQISYINLSLFRDVPDLRFLSLESNKLTDLNEEMFVRLVRLEHLDIGKNELKTLPAKLFGTLWSLRKLSVSDNEFSSLPSDLLTNNNNLEECYLSNNHGSLTSLPEAMFGNLSYLKILGLGGNRLVELQENSFWGSYNLTKLDLSGNALAKLPENIFQDSENLVELNLNSNMMDSLPNRLFDIQNKLAHLYLGQNRLTTISRLIFSNLTSLIELDLSSNRIHHLEEDCFKSLWNLRTARLSNNSIESPINGFEVTSLFLNCKNLDALFLDRNKIFMDNFRWMAEMHSLGVLDMDSNFVSTLKGLLETTYTMKEQTEKFRYIRIILTNNNITRIPLPWSTGRYDTSGLVVEVSVANNPLNCGCSLYQLLELLVRRSDIKCYYGFRLMLGTLACKEPTRMQGQRVSEIDLKTFSCPDESPDDFAYCVENCDCLWRPYDDAALIDCSRKFDGRLPDTFIGFRGSRIELDLIGNRLTRVPFSDTTAFKLITKLFLSHNLISSISSIDIPPKIEVLHLDHNRLKTWETRTLRDIESSRTLKELALKDNPWKCDRNTDGSLALIEQKFTEPVTYTSESRCIDGRHITQAEKLPRLYITYTRF